MARKSLKSLVLIAVVFLFYSTAASADTPGWRITQLTNNSFNDEAPQISGTNIVWAGSDGDYEIFFYDGATTTQLTNNIFIDGDPQISGTNIVWIGNDGNDFEIFFYNGTTTTQLTNNIFNDLYPQISGTNVVWDGSGEIFFYNGTITTQLTNNSFFPGILKFPEQMLSGIAMTSATMRYSSITEQLQPN